MLKVPPVPWKLRAHSYLPLKDSCVISFSVALNTNLVIPIFITSILPCHWYQLLTFCWLLPWRPALAFIFTQRRISLLALSWEFAGYRKMQECSKNPAPKKWFNFKEKQSALPWMTFLCPNRYLREIHVYPEANFCSITQSFLSDNFTLRGMNVWLPVKVTCSWHSTNSIRREILRSASLLPYCHRKPCRLKTGVQCSKGGTVLLKPLSMSLS